VRELRGLARINPVGQFIDTWVGEASAWQCDDLGHLNMRHYMTKAREARQMFIIRLGLSEAFTPRTSSTVRVRDFHIKYLAEARPGDSLRIQSGLIDITETQLVLCHMMYHADHRLAATIVETVEHFSIPSGKAFAWPQRVREKSGDFQIDLPDSAKPRGLRWDAPHIGPDLATLKGWGMKPIGMGVFQDAEMDRTQAAKAEAILGRTTETIAAFKEGWEELQDAELRAQGLLGALLEMRAFINSPARTGDPYLFFSGVQSNNTHTRTLIHNIVNPVSGKNYSSMIAVGCLFNLNTRKLVKASPEQVVRIQANAISGITA